MSFLVRHEFMCLLLFLRISREKKIKQCMISWNTFFARVAIAAVITYSSMKSDFRRTECQLSLFFCLRSQESSVSGLVLATASAGHPHPPHMVYTVMIHWALPWCQVVNRDAPPAFRSTVVLYLPWWVGDASEGGFCLAHRLRVTRMLRCAAGAHRLRYPTPRREELGGVRGGADGRSEDRLRQGYAEDAPDTVGHLGGR